MTAVNDLRNDVGDDVVQDEERLVLGTMTGTSIDGLDAALISVHGRGLAARVALVAHEAFSFPAPLANALRAAAEQIPMTSGAFATLQRDFGVFHAECLQ
ncbi:MAG: anhydro-N-acetylmuramic acid kinase, partial [Phycisphaerae bacterium]|nr:anhydro-N-acetylmuramic acid kinase [Phycisphaerae bacterium]